MGVATEEGSTRSEPDSHCLPLLPRLQGPYTQSTLLATTTSSPPNYGQPLRQEESTATPGLRLPHGRSARRPLRQSPARLPHLRRPLALQRRLQHLSTHHESHPHRKWHRAQSPSPGTPQIRPRAVFGRLDLLQHPSKFPTDFFCRRLLHTLHRVH